MFYRLLTYNNCSIVCPSLVLHPVLLVDVHRLVQGQLVNDRFLLYIAAEDKKIPSEIRIGKAVLYHLPVLILQVHNLIFSSLHFLIYPCNYAIDTIYERSYIGIFPAV